ncbi:MAG: dihydropteroate synthase-like protein [Methanosarcinaceae archaeon]
MKILVATGYLAEDTVRGSVGSIADIVVIDTDVAAFITPHRLLHAIKEQYPATSFDMILVPGLVSGDFSGIANELDCRIYLGPKHAYDLAFAISFAEKVEFSTLIPACELLSDVRMDMALKTIADIEEKALPCMIIGNRKIGGGSRMKVLAEVVDATGLSDDELIQAIKSFIRKGADMIDLGASLGATTDDVERAVTIARKCSSVPISIDTLEPDLIISAIEAGIDLVLSLNGTNIDRIGKLLARSGIPVVIIPDNMHEPDSLIRNIEDARSLGIKDIIADPVLDPPGHGIVGSILRYQQFHEDYPGIPLFFGVGNVSELIDADSIGVNAVLCGIAADVGASVLFTPEYSTKTQGSISELATASNMMVLASLRNSSPKDLGIDLLTVKEKRRRPDVTLPKDFITARSNDNWQLDPAGAFRIGIVPNGSNGTGLIVTMHENVSIVGRDADEVMDTIIDMELVSRLEHAGYLGQELARAELALKLNRSYSQDDDL